MDEKRKGIDPFIPINKNEPFTDPVTGVSSDGSIRPFEYDEKTKSPEEKIYIILYKLNSDEDDDIYTQIFNICIGRTEAYRDIKEKLESGLEVDVHVSKIITETKQTETSTADKKYFLLPYKECISIYAFCKSIQDYYSDDEFDIEDYNTTEIPEKDEILSKSNQYLTAEQESYRKMLNLAIKHDEEYFDGIRRELEEKNSNIDKQSNNL